MILYTIGFTRKSAEQFFRLLQTNDVQCIVDIRLHPNSQLAGFTKKDDLQYFLAHLLNCDYKQMQVLAPTEELLSEYRNDHDWERYASRFETLMEERNVPDCLDKLFFMQKKCCLLCSEAQPEKCHRRLVAERLARSWRELEIVHLM